MKKILSLNQLIVIANFKNSFALEPFVLRKWKD